MGFSHNNKKLSIPNDIFYLQIFDEKIKSKTKMRFDKSYSKIFINQLQAKKFKFV